jgi:glutathione S-transferase
MIQLHYFPSNASFTPHVLLREIGVPFELKLVDRTQQAHKAPDYLKLNPNGLIPVLVDGDLVLYETAAIALHLADTHPAAQLMPPLGTAERAQAYKWLMWLTNTVQPTVINYYYPDRWAAPGDEAGAAAVKARAVARLKDLLQQIDDHLASHGGPWFLGQQHSLLDAFAFMLCRWTRGFSEYPARSFPHIAPWLARVAARPAVVATVQAEQLPMPLY